LVDQRTIEKPVNYFRGMPIPIGFTMFFDLDWTLDDARYVTSETYDACAADPANKKAEKALRKQGEMFSASIRALNEGCQKEMAKYRQAVVSRASKEDQEKLFDELYAAYQDRMSRLPFQRFFAFFGIT
jgi:TPP-dependent pyruvate/acetoin dehydrogenase alpha subunit